MVLGFRGLEFDLFVEIGDGILEPAQLEVERPTAVVRQGEHRAQLDHPVIVGEGLVVLLAMLEDSSANEEPSRVARGGFNGLTGQIERFVNPSVFVRRNGAGEQILARRLLSHQGRGYQRGREQRRTQHLSNHKPPRLKAARPKYARKHSDDCRCPGPRHNRAIEHSRAADGRGCEKILGTVNRDLMDVEDSRLISCRL